MDPARARRAIQTALLIVICGTLVYISLLPRPFVYREVPTDIPAEELRWRERIEAVGAASAHEEFEEAVRLLGLRDQHTAAHIFGGSLYEEEGIDGLVFCNTQSIYGCFHEFLSRALVKNGLSIVPALVEKCDASPYRDGSLSCEHGLGHGILAYFGYEKKNLHDAVKTCNSLKQEPVRACLDGVFMEYNLRHFSAADGSDARTVPEENPYDPCTMYQGDEAKLCVGILPLWWRTAQFAGDVETTFIQIGKRCANMPASLKEQRGTCFKGIGFIAAYAAAPAVQKMAQLCRLAASSEEDNKECILYASLTVKTAFGINEATSLCHSLAKEEHPACEEYVRSGKLL